MQGDPGPHTPGPLGLRGYRPCVLGWLGLQFHALVKSVLLKLRAVALTRGLSLYRVLATSWGLQSRGSGAGAGGGCVGWR